MEKPPTSIRTLAQRLLAMEAAGQAAADLPRQEAVRVCEKLRISLTRFAGADGFTALMRRALVLARADVPALHSVEVKADGSLEGLKELTVGEHSGGIEASTAIATHLLGLLVTFVGEPITLRLVREAWPEASLDE
jgi:hypothetical protein